MSRPTLLTRIGLGRPELRAWAIYDWANSAFMTTIIAAVFPVYFISVASEGIDPNRALTYFSTATAVAIGVVAVFSPFLGAIADFAGARLKFLAAFIALGVLSTGCMYFIGRGDWLLACVLFVLGNIGVSGSLVFYDSLLPHLAAEREIDQVSSAGYSLGYLGGGLLLGVNSLWIVWPEAFGLSGAESAARLSFLSVALWWLGFSVPLLRRVREPARKLEADEEAGTSLFPVALRRLRETMRELRQFRNALLMLAAFLLYNDGINTIIRMAGAYGQSIGLAPSALIGAILLVQFVATPFAILFGRLAGRIGAKNSIFIALVAYTGISVVAYSMKTSRDFYLLAILVATVQGGSQALSRSLFASMIPRHKPSEFFGFFGVTEKFGGILGPAIFAVLTAWLGSGRTAILSLVAFFVLGGALLWFVNIEEGRREASRAEQKLQTIST